MNETLVSIIIPTYKGHEVIGRALQSALDQTYRNTEIIIVDDNAPDSQERKDTESVLSTFTNNNRVIYLKHQENKNGAAARNTGIRFAHGKYIAFLDDDDWFLPTKIERQVNFLENHQEYTAVYCLAQRSGTPIETVPYEGNLTKQLLLMETKMFTPSLMFLTQSLKALHGFDESFRRHQDYELLLRFFKADYKIGCVKEVLLELGTGGNNNNPNSQSMLQLKKSFLDKFASDIDAVDSKEPGFRNKALALHYGMVLIPYFQEGEYEKALRLFRQYFVLSPSYFTKGLRKRVKLFLLNRIPFAK